MCTVYILEIYQKRTIKFSEKKLIIKIITKKHKTTKNFSSKKSFKKCNKSKIIQNLKYFMFLLKLKISNSQKTKFQKNFYKKFQVPKPDPIRHSTDRIYDLEQVYDKCGITREIIDGGTPEELLQPPVKSVGYRTETQIKLMRKMRFVANKLNLTQVNFLRNFENRKFFE